MECGWPVAGTALSGRSMVDRCGYFAEKSVPLECEDGAGGAGGEGEEGGDAALLKTRTHHLREWWEIILPRDPTTLKASPVAGTAVSCFFMVDCCGIILTVA